MEFSYARFFRTLHKWSAIIISIPIIVVILTGIVLQVRKPSNFIQPNLHFGVSVNQPTASLEEILESVKAVPEMKVESWKDVRILDLRPKQGTVKVRNREELETQIDARTAEVLNVGQRWNDIITLMHEGTTWGLRLWVFLPVALIALVLSLTGFYLIVQVTAGKLRTRKRRRAAQAQQQSSAGNPAAPASNRRFNLMAFCRKYHYALGIVVIAPWMIVAASGVLLQIRYEVPWVMPQLHKGIGRVPTVEFEDVLASARLLPNAGVKDWKDVWRVYVYPNRGIISIRAKNRQQIQFDAQTGELLDVSVRRTDFIEDIHEGKWMGMNLWLFLPVHFASTLLWMLGVFLWGRSLFSRRKKAAN